MINGMKIECVHWYITAVSLVCCYSEWIAWLHKIKFVTQRQIVLDRQRLERSIWLRCQCTCAIPTDVGISRQRTDARRRSDGTTSATEDRSTSTLSVLGLRNVAIFRKMPAQQPSEKADLYRLSEVADREPIIPGEMSMFAERRSMLVDVPTESQCLPTHCRNNVGSFRQKADSYRNSVFADERPTCIDCYVIPFFTSSR